MSTWVSWGTFQGSDPRLAASIRELLYQYGRGMAYLATVRKDGAPRLHPVSPIVTDESMFCFVIASPKRHDLHRDGRFALHSFPAESSDAEAYVSGRAREVINLSIVDQMAAANRAAPSVDWTLFEFMIDFAMLHRASPGRAPAVWRAPARRPSPAPRQRLLIAA